LSVFPHAVWIPICIAGIQWESVPSSKERKITVILLE
jgi:hypothetical protein